MSAGAFWAALDARLGTYTIAGLESAAEIGSGTLRNARKRDAIPTLDTVLAVARVLNAPPAALLGDATPPELRAPAADASLRRIPLACIFASHLNPRRSFDDTQTAELADSIAAQGLLQNLVVRRDRDQAAMFWITAGERRARALKLLEAEGRLPADLALLGIPCRVIEIDDEEHVALALLENLQRVDVNPMEEAEALDRLHRANPEKWTTKLLAERLGKTQRFVQYRLALAARLPDGAKTALRDGRLNLEQARLICAAPDDEKESMVRRAVEHGVSASALASQVTHSFFAAEYALFDAASCGLETWTDPNTDEIYFTDFDAAMKLQEKAVHAREQQFLDDGAEFVELADYFRRDLFQPGGSGVVIEVNEETGEIVFFEGVARISEKSAPVKEKPRVSQWEIDARYAQDVNKAARALVAKLRGVLTPTDAIALFLYDCAMPWGNRTLNPQAVNSEGATQQALFNTLRSFKKGDPEAWKHVRNATELADLDRAFAETIGGMIMVKDGHPVSPALTDIAKRNKIAVPAILRHTTKQKAEAKKRIEEDLAGQTDLEDAITGLTEAEAAEAMAGIDDTEEAA